MNPDLLFYPGIAIGIIGMFLGKAYSEKPSRVRKVVFLSVISLAFILISVPAFFTKHVVLTFGPSTESFIDDEHG